MKTNKITNIKDAKKSRAKKEGATDIKPAIEKAEDRTFREIPLSLIQANPLNPRKNFSGTKYDELVASIRRKGVLVPVLLRPLLYDPDSEIYEIIAGERRFRASCEIAKSNGGIENKKIPAIIQKMTEDEAYDCMTIENLQRADLTPLEEARAFKLYLDKKGQEALPDLAERIEINPCYIRRRIAVLELPENMLKSWEDGEIAYGHLEQLVRISDLEEQKNLFEDINRRGMSVKDLKESIESRTPKLASALFSKQSVGCPTCPRNTSVQRNLFGEDVASKALCLNPDCYKQNQEEWIKANWEKFKSSRKLVTNGFRFTRDLNYNERIYMWGSLKSKCKTCENCITTIHLDGKVDDKEICIGQQKCRDALYNPSSAAAKKEKDPGAPRVSWHGVHFREEHFKTRIPELVSALPQDDEKVLRILLLTLIETHEGARRAFGQKYDSDNMTKNQYTESTWYSIEDRSWAVIEKLDSATIKTILQELSLIVIMDKCATTASTRRQVATHLGSDLVAEWRITKEYLDKKTTKEIHAIAEQFSFFKDDKARNHLFETIGKKRDRFDLCKKGELIKVILESGIDLSGKVPDEILNP